MGSNNCIFIFVEPHFRVFKHILIVVYSITLMTLNVCSRRCADRETFRLHCRRGRSDLSPGIYSIEIVSIASIEILSIASIALVVLIMIRY